MLSNLIKLIAYRLYLDKNVDDLRRIINTKLPRDTYGLILLCGKSFKNQGSQKKYNIVQYISKLIF